MPTSPNGRATPLARLQAQLRDLQGLTAREQAKVLTAMRRTLEDEQHRLLTAAQRRRRRAEQRRQQRAQRQAQKLRTLAEVGRAADWTGDYPGAPQRSDEQVAADLEAAMPDPLAGRRGCGTARYWSVLGLPPQCEAGDRASADSFYRKVLNAIEVGGWTRSERAALSDLEQKWGRRARGEDARFMRVGIRTGRLPRVIEREIAEQQTAELPGAPGSRRVRIGPYADE